MCHCLMDFYTGCKNYLTRVRRGPVKATIDFVQIILKLNIKIYEAEELYSNDLACGLPCGLHQKQFESLLFGRIGAVQNGSLFFIEFCNELFCALTLFLEVW